MGCGHDDDSTENDLIRQAAQRSFFQGSTKDSIVPVAVTQFSVVKATGAVSQLHPQTTRPVAQMNTNSKCDCSCLYIKLGGTWCAKWR